MTELDIAPVDGTAPVSRPARSRGTDPTLQRAVLDALPARVVLTDRDLVITYANPATVEGLRALADWIPVAPDEIVGAGLDVLHRDASYQRALLADPTGNLPRRTVTTLGPETLELTVAPVHDEQGAYVGVMATWETVTERLRLEKEVARVTAMLESSPTCTVFAGPDLVVTSVNPASLAAFRSLEAHLPVDAANVVGSSLDLVFADPAFERGLLADPARLPHRATITLGPETLDLEVAAIHDATGGFVGVMATWSVLTERLRDERRREEAATDTAAVNKVLSSVGEASTPEQAVRTALDVVRSEFGWAYGSYWAIDPGDGTLKFSAESGDAGEEFRAVTLRASFAKGVGLSGRAWATGDLFFTRDIGEMTDCVRAPVAQRVGVRSGICFPVTVDGEVVGTMDFFTTETLDPSAQRLDALRNVGRLVSAALTRIGKEAADREAAAELARKVDVVLEVVRAAGAGDLTQEITVSGDDAIGQLAAGLAGLLETLRGSMTEIGHTADTLAVAAEQLTILSQGMGEGATLTSDRASSASSASVQVSASIQTVASAAEEMTASIREIAKNATEAASVATGAVAVAGSAQGTVATLGESSAEIGQVVKVITSIAQQTNLLALNATIEAARAGDAGKGFAVVANEVKELAKETAKATEDISAKIDAIQSDTSGAVAAIAEISEVIGRINDIQTTIASAVEEQTATTNEIARSVTEAAAGANGIAEDVTQVASAADDTRQGAQNTLQSATDLAGMAAQLKGRVEQFTV